MKSNALACLVLLAGCSSAPAPLPPPPAKRVVDIQPIAAAPSPAEVAAARIAQLERDNRRHAQHIEALISQNDALTEKLGSFPARPAQELAVPMAAAMPRADKAPTSDAAKLAPLVPNADGVVDLAALVVREANTEPVNPFAVRTLPADAIREIDLHVGGTVHGVVPCAIVNDRLVQPGDVVETLKVTQVDADAVEFEHGERRLRIPVSGKATRVRLPL